ncbi:hypothetical protein HG531_008382 [Fusarium graminearum]|nr:hypothetical protein HG531_008382 [Fusarium graminearum]
MKVAGPSHDVDKDVLGTNVAISETSGEDGREGNAICSLGEDGRCGSQDWRGGEFGSEAVENNCKDDIHGHGTTLKDTEVGSVGKDNLQASVETIAEARVTDDDNLSAPLRHVVNTSRAINAKNNHDNDTSGQDTKSVGNTKVRHKLGSTGKTEEEACSA